SQQLVDLPVELIQDPDRLRRIGLGEELLDGHAGIEHVLHASSRASRMSSTARFTSPCLRRNSSRIRSMRSRAIRLASGSTMPRAACSARSCNSAMSSGGMTGVLLAVLTG